MRRRSGPEPQILLLRKDDKWNQSTGHQMSGRWSFNCFESVEYERVERSLFQGSFGLTRRLFQGLLQVSNDSNSVDEFMRKLYSSQSPFIVQYQLIIS